MVSNHECHEITETRTLKDLLMKMRILNLLQKGGNENPIVIDSIEMEALEEELGKDVMERFKKDLKEKYPKEDT
ncbi:hypothetical protein FNV43_RR27306 [Rhamnella rubrinervis]|uniref:Uncharacterized protein n=1 Tax=Rhamnella rubrinervis TaxID=2594499 RepID=A0A8K0GPJ9_9ROSA|nr:hypothetical protein FNV43_RR27306 [Rhamnella rubrinervis]